MGQDPAFPNLHQELIDRCREGDRRAQFEIYKLYYRAMYNASFRIMKNSAEAEDIMQESFLVAFQKLETYSGTVSFGAWLKKIVINRSLDVLRKNKLIFESLDEKPLTVADSNKEAGEEDVEEVPVEVIREAILNLADGYRIVLSLYLLEGYDHDEIAEILGITASTSRSQFARARSKLVSILKEKLDRK